MRPASDVLPPEVYGKLVADSQARAACLRAAGPGWEDRAAAMLWEAVGL